MSPSELQHAGQEPAVQYCTFKVDHLLIGVEVWRVQEVIRQQPMTHVPLAPREVRGLINLRGQIVTAIDMRCWLGLPERAGGSPAMNAVMRLSEEAVSLLVDEAGAVVEPPLSSYEPVPSTASEQIRALFSGTYKLEDALLLVLDIDAITRLTGEPGQAGSPAASRRVP